MARLEFDLPDDRLYETGVKHGVLFPCLSLGVYGAGVAWNGLTAVTESPSGAEPTPLYADSIKYLNLMSVEEFKFTIEAYTYPDAFAPCDGSLDIAQGSAIGQQKRNAFGLCYKTSIGNGAYGTDYGYKLHLIYGALASPSEKSYTAINKDPEAMTFSWEATTTPVEFEGFDPTSYFTITSSKIIDSKLRRVEDILYGTASTAPRLPSLEELMPIVTNRLLDSTGGNVLDQNGKVLMDGLGF